jgi:rhomboid protease GluP
MSVIEQGDERTSGWRNDEQPVVILPPVAPDPYVRNMPRPRRPRPQWASAPATYVLGGINCVVFLLMCFSGASPTAPTPEQLLRWGADYGPLVLVLGQWWRLVSAMFVHIGILHLATNMWCLWNLGLLGEPLVGAWGLFAAYLLSGIGGNLLSVAMHPGLPGTSEGIVGAGASGAVFGLAGLLIVLLKSKLLPLPEFELKRLRRSVIWFAVLNFVLGAGTWVAHTSLRIDNMAHLGGFLTGLALALPMVPKLGVFPDLFRRRRNLAVGVISLGLLLLAFGMQSFYRPGIVQIRARIHEQLRQQLPSGQQPPVRQPR